MNNTGLDGYRHLALESVDSTNAECMRRALAGEPGNLWITAKTQQSGKARRGRKWVSETGNLYTSLLLTGDLQASATLPFVASLAVARAIMASVGQDKPEIALKWPNDVLINGKKISGILLEASVVPGGKQTVIIGIGINCRHHPANPLYPATSLLAQGFDTKPENLFEKLKIEMHAALELWDAGRGFAMIRQAWLTYVVGLGSPIVARFDDREESGTFVDIDERGLLVLETATGRKLISAADIFFGKTEKDGIKQK